MTETLNVMPAIDATGFTPTLNRMGGMTPVLDAFGEAFVAFAPTAPGPVLDVGAAYGVASLAALAAGATVIANDLDPRHLAVLLERAPQVDRDRLTLLPGQFPDGIDLAENSLGAVLLARMLHFLDGPTIIRGLAKLHAQLAPGGKVFGVAVTPYLSKLVPFRPTYEARQAAGDPWPGTVSDVSVYDPEGATALPSEMHFLDETVLRRELEAAGFHVERLEYGSRAAFVGEMKLDGREMIGFIASKPFR